MNAQHASPADQTPRQSLSPRDGAVLAVCVVAMAAASVAGQRLLAYACVAVAGAWLVARLAAQRPRGATRHARSALEATPPGYQLGLVGLGLAIVGIVGDAAWHAAFGAEHGIAQVLAPFHLMLIAGAGLMLASPVRAAWDSSEYLGPLTLRRALPPVLGLALCSSLILLVLQLLSDSDAGLAVVGRLLVTDAVLLWAALLALRFQLPFTAMTLLFVLPATLAAALRGSGVAASIVAGLAAGIVADTLVRRLRPGHDATRTFAIVTSVAFTASYLIAAAVTGAAVLPLDLAFGAIFIAALIGIVLAPLAFPRTPEDEEAPAPAPATIPEPLVEGLPARRRPKDAADLRFAAQVAGSAAVAEHPVGATALCALLRGRSADEVAAMFEPPLDSRELVQLCRDTTPLYDAWATQSLRQLDVVYLFLEAVSLPGTRDASGDRRLLGAWGITRHGKRVLLGLRTGRHDRATAWGALGADLVERGLSAPALVVADGAPGVWRVISELWPDAATQHCSRHALAEVADALSDDARRDLRARVRSALESSRSSAEATRRLEEVLDDHRDEAPAQMAILHQRLERLTAHLAFPREHRRVLRSATVLQRALAPLAEDVGSSRRLPGDVSALALAWAVLDLGAPAARRLPMPLHAAAQLDRLRRRHMPIHDASGTPEA